MGKHIDYTAELKYEIWGRYKNGDSIRSIGRFIDRPSSSIYKRGRGQVLNFAFGMKMHAQ